MVTYAVGAEKFGEKLLYVEKSKDVYPFPKNILVGEFKSSIKAQNYIDKHSKKISKLLEKEGYKDYDLSVIRIDAPCVTSV